MIAVQENIILLMDYRIVMNVQLEHLRQESKILNAKIASLEPMLLVLDMVNVLNVGLERLLQGIEILNVKYAWLEIMHLDQKVQHVFPVKRVQQPLIRKHQVVLNALLASMLKVLEILNALIVQQEHIHLLKVVLAFLVQLEQGK